MLVMADSRLTYLVSVRWRGYRGGGARCGQAVHQAGHQAVRRVVYQMKRSKPSYLFCEVFIVAGVILDNGRSSMR